MPLTVFDYKNGTASPAAQALSGLGAIPKKFIADLIAENAACKDYFNHSDDRDPSTNGGKAPTGIDVKIYYMPCTDKEYHAWEVIGLKSDTLWASGRRRVAVRKDTNGVHKFYLANHTGKSIAGTRDNSTYTYTEVNLAK